MGEGGSRKRRAQETLQPQQQQPATAAAAVVEVRVGKGTDPRQRASARAKATEEEDKEGCNHNKQPQPLLPKMERGYEGRSGRCLYLNSDTARQRHSSSSSDNNRQKKKVTRQYNSSFSSKNSCLLKPLHDRTACVPAKTKICTSHCSFSRQLVILILVAVLLFFSVCVVPVSRSLFIWRCCFHNYNSAGFDLFAGFVFFVAVKGFTRGACKCHGEILALIAQRAPLPG